MPWPVNLNGVGGVIEGYDMTLERRVRRMEEQHRKSGQQSLAVIMQPGETLQDAIARTIEKFHDGHVTMIVVPAKRPSIPDP